MSGAAYRDEEATLLEARAQLLAVRRADEARAAVSARVRRDRVSRLVWGAASLAASLALASLDLFEPDIVATPAGGTWLGRALLFMPLAALGIVPLSRLRGRPQHAFVESRDVRGDLERLRAPSEPGPEPAPSRTLVHGSLALPLGVLALWPPLLALHAAIDLVPAPLRYYEIMPSLVLRRMGDAEALAQLLTGGALLALFSAGAYAIAIERTILRGFRPPDMHVTIARAFGGVLFGAVLAQLCTAWVEASAISVGAGYAALVAGGLTGVFGWRAVLGYAGRVASREG